jgi:hypothetical protein
MRETRLTAEGYQNDLNDKCRLAAIYNACHDPVFEEAATYVEDTVVPSLTFYDMLQQFSTELDDNRPTTTTTGKQSITSSIALT